MSGLVQLCAVKVDGENHGAAIVELLLVAQTNLENEGFDYRVRTVLNNELR